jgi:hypothetical protein
MAGRKKKANRWERTPAREAPYFLNDKEADAAESLTREPLPSGSGEDLNILETIRELPGETAEPVLMPKPVNRPPCESERDSQSAPHNADWTVEPFLAVNSNNADASWVREYDQPVGR